jgi:hypothetical protein
MTPSVPPAPRTALALLFGPDEDKPAAIAQLLQSADIGGDIRGALDRLPPLTREAAVGQVSSAAAELLNVNLADVVADGWRKHADLTAAARRTLAARGSTDLVDLASHRVTAGQEPYVSLLVDGHRVATVRFGLSLVFEISALLAEVKAGRLVALHSGRCEVTGALAIQDINTITRQAHVDMPGMIPLHEGIRLLPAHNYPADHTPGSADDNFVVGR